MTNCKNASGAPEVARLVRAAEREGGKRKTLTQLVEAASERGAARVLARLGLHDETASEDIRELRDLLEVWRETKRTAWHTFVRWMTTLFILAILAVLALRLKLPFLNP